MGSRTVITAIAVAGVALLSAGSAGAIQEEIHVQGVVDSFGGTGSHFSIGDPFEATIMIDVAGDPVFLSQVNNLPMTYTLTIAGYSASGLLPAEFEQAFLVYEDHNTFGDGVSIEETAGDFADAPPLDVAGPKNPWDFSLYDSSERERQVWTEPSLSEVLVELPSLPDPRFRLEWFIGLTVEGPITSVTVPEPSAELLWACAILATVGLAVRAGGRRRSLAEDPR